MGLNNTKSQTGVVNEIKTRLLCLNPVRVLSGRGSHSEQGDYQDTFVWRKIAFLWKNSKMKGGFSPLATTLSATTKGLNIVNPSLS